jgi:alpha-D-ribose 1-methylphosphonate 5-triphosphate diphosphatase PhnM
MTIKSVLLTAAMAAVSANSFADAPQPERHVQAFLNVLNGAGVSLLNSCLHRMHVRC